MKFSAADNNGGAIDCNSPNMVLRDTVFVNNQADTGAALCREVNASGGSGFNNTFRNNHAITNGSALAWINASRIVIDNYFFYNNDAGNSGGAIYVGKGSENCEILNCIFEDNEVLNIAGGHGGAIEWYAEDGLVENSTFTSNRAYNGGAIFVGHESDDINIINSNFTNNHAYLNGGAINLEASSITINKSNFYYNTAREGGALYVGGQGADNLVISSKFVGNNATEGRGGAIDWVASSGNILDSIFISNNAMYGGGVYLGGLSNQSLIDRCVFENNYAEHNGGAIDSNASKMYLTNTRFISNYAQYGAALCREANATGGNGTNNTFISNHAYIAGAALGWMKSDKISIVNYTFINNTANVYGGAIYVGPGSDNSHINNSYFEGNRITPDGYSMYDDERMDYFTPSGKLVRINITHYGLTLDSFGHGGAVYVAAMNATVFNASFIRNEADKGGALFVASDSGNTRIINATFRQNIANLRGGAVNLNASAVHIDDSLFYDNVAINGSALYVGGEGTNNKVHVSTFVGNIIIE